MSRALINEAIIAAEVIVIDDRGVNLGSVPRERALEMARSRDCDLVQDGVFSSPPTCRLVPAGAAGARATRDARIATGGPPKEIRLGTAMGAHDIETRLRQAAGLLARGYGVKLSVRLAKAERANPTAARTLLAELGRRLAADGTVERKPFGESGALSMLVAPRDD